MLEQRRRVLAVTMPSTAKKKGTDGEAYDNNRRHTTFHTASGAALGGPAALADRRRRVCKRFLRHCPCQRNDLDFLQE